MFQLYVDAPDATNAEVCPEHIVDVNGAKVIEVIELTVMVIVFTVLTQPADDVPVTEYTVVLVGLTTLTEPVPEGNHVYVLAPVAVIVDELPEHKLEDDAVSVTIGMALIDAVTAVRIGVVQPAFVAST